MMQKNQITNWEKLNACSYDTKSLKINVFTSSSCSFCSEALEKARDVALKFQNFDMPVEVVETSVEDKPDVVEALSVIAVPMIMIGKSKIIGLPQTEDIELLLHQNALSR
jgi:glutaredoxin